MPNRCEGMVPVVYSWSFREIESGADVLFEYRVAVRGEARSRATDPEPLYQLSAMTDRTMFFDIGEQAGQNGQKWSRFVIDNRSLYLSPCNTVAEAALIVRSESEEVRVSFIEEYPGHDRPFDAAASAQDGSEMRDEASAFDTAPPISGESVERVLWTDWIEIVDDQTVTAEVTFADGTTVELEPERRGHP
jgi:hypothetical protein